MLPPGIAFPELGFWVLHVIAMALVFVWGYRRGRQAEREEREQDRKPKDPARRG
jgi:hypothetical protein